MRLNRLDKRSRGVRPPADGVAVERVEALLRQAAEFEPQIQPAGDYIRQALAAQNRVRLRRAKPLLPVFSSLASGVAAAALLLFVLSRTDQGVNQGVPLVNLPEETLVSPPASQSDSRVAGSTAGKPVPNSAVGIKPPAAVAQNDVVPIRRSGPSEYRASRALQNASMTSPTPRTEVAHNAAPRIPKVRWKTETVQRYDRGVIEPAYIVEEKDRNGDVVYQPVMMPVTTETGARPLLTDSMPDTSIQLTSLSEETTHK